MNKPSNINFGRLAFVLLIGGSLLYSFIISGYLEEETRRVADISIEYGFYAGYSLWVLGMVLSNILSINRITRRKYARSKGLNTALQIWSQTLLGAGKASIVAPVKVYRELSGQGNLLVRLVSMVEVYIMRPIVSLAVLAAYALLSALFILPLSFFKLQTSRFSSEETNENGVRMLPVACVAGSDTTRTSLLRALVSALGNVSVPRWYTYDTPRINTTRTQPRYNYIELLLSRKRNDKQPTLCLQICDFEGSDAASINSLDAMPFYSLLQGAVFVVEETAGSASFAQAFDKWHELMSTAYKTRLQKLKCAVVIRSNDKILPFDESCELDAGADQAACRHFLHDLQWADVLGKADLFRNTAFFSISSSDQELNECPGVYALAKWLLQNIPA